MPTTELLPHIRRDEKGVAWVDDTNIKVIELVLAKQAHGYSAEEMHLQYPHLSLAQIHAALGYYYDHQADLDEQAAARSRLADEIRARTEDPGLQARLHELKKSRTP